MALKRHGKATHLLLIMMNPLVSTTFYFKSYLWSQIQNLSFNVSDSDHSFGGWLLPSLDQTRRRPDQFQTGSSRSARGDKKVVRINIE